MIKVSIIVPTYNVKEYVVDTISDLVNQSLKEIEIIVIDDGSKDETVERIRENFNDKRIKIFHKENGGVSSARNYGLNFAVGEYIAFVDSDDRLHKDMLKELYENSKNFDIVFCDYSEFGNIERERVEEYKNKYPYLDIFNEKRAEYIYIPELTVIWNKIYKREFLERECIRFLNEIIHEDVEFSLKVFMTAKTCGYVNKALYKYRKNRPESIMNTVNVEKIEKAYKKIYKTFETFENSLEKKSFKRARIGINRQRFLAEKLSNSQKGLTKEDAVLIKKRIKEILENTNLENNQERAIIKNDIKWVYKNKKLLKQTKIFEGVFWPNKINMFNLGIRILKQKLKK
ncbi:MAG: glycosyltransferase family 2 protein [Cetobacterium sp.]